MEHAISAKRVTLGVQLALGVAFGTALLWKQLRAARHLTPVASYGAPATDTWQPSRDAHRARRSPGAPSARGVVRSMTFDGISDQLRLAVILFAAAAVPVLIGVTWAITRSDGAPSAPPRVNVPVHTAPIPTVPALTTATLSDQVVDARRALDLATVRQAADAYAALFGAYPTTGGELTPLCARTGDPGCAIAKYATSFPTSDGQHSYWYASDGETMTLVAQVSSAPEQDNCAAGLTAPLGGVPVLCVTSRVPAH